MPCTAFYYYEFMLLLWVSVLRFTNLRFLQIHEDILLLWIHASTTRLRFAIYEFTAVTNLWRYSVAILAVLLNCMLLVLVTCFLPSTSGICCLTASVFVLLVWFCMINSFICFCTASYPLPLPLPSLPLPCCIRPCGLDSSLYYIWYILVFSNGVL